MRIRRALNVLVYYMSAVVPRSQRLVVFGAWHGYRYSDNPRYLYEYLRQARLDLDLVWCGRESIRSDVPVSKDARFVRRGSLRSIWAVLRAGSLFVSHDYHDLLPYNLTCRAALVYLGHGVAIKNMGTREGLPDPDNRFVAWFRRFRRGANAYTYCVASSPAHKEKLLFEYASQNCRDDNTVVLGQPRSDLFTHPDRQRTAQRIRNGYAASLGIPVEKQLVTYMPTFRDREGGGQFSFRDLEGEHAGRLSSILDRHNAVLIERGHFVDGVLRRRQQSRDSVSNIVDLSLAEDVDSIELLLVSDLLITDYSGAYVDYLLLDRPVLHFVYDYDDYVESDRGLYFDLVEVAGGPLLPDVTTLLQELDQQLENPALEAERRSHVRRILLTDEHGRSCEAVMEGLLPPPP